MLAWLLSCTLFDPVIPGPVMVASGAWKNCPDHCYTSMWINTNGNISFGASGINSFTPEPFPLVGRPLIAPFFADVDTRTDHGLPNENLIYYHYHYDSSDADGTPRRLIVTWYRVDYYAGGRAPGTNTFQIILYC